MGGLVIILGGSSWFLTFLCELILKEVPVSMFLKRLDFKIWIVTSL
jgi:hypothetical protein